MVLVNVEKHFTGVGKFQIEGKKCTFLWTNCFLMDKLYIRCEENSVENVVSGEKL